MKQISLATTRFELVTKSACKRVKFQSQGRSSLQGSQMPVVFHKAARQRVGQEHRPICSSVCQEQLVAGQKTHHSGNARMGTPAMREMAFFDSFINCLTVEARFCGDSSNHR
jgi:hypothetical protein